MNKFLCMIFICTMALFIGACSDEEMSSSTAPINAASKDKTHDSNDGKVSPALPEPADSDEPVAPPVVAGDPLPPMVDPMLPPPLPYPDGVFLGGGGGGGRRKRESPETPQVSLSLTKTASATELVLDEVITYTFTLTNDGELPIADVTITDPLSGLSAITCMPSTPIASLVPDDVVNCTATYTVTAADVTAGTLSNTATASGTGPNDESISDAATAVISNAGEPTVSDFSDAPASYGTPSHEVSATPTLMLGTLIDTEASSFPSAGADGDDNNNSDDEDAVGDIIVFANTATTVSLSVFNDTGSDATLAGWIDFNNNGSFESPSERVTATVSSSGSAQPIDLVFPGTPLTAPASSYARFRLFPGDAVANPDPSPTLAATDGEVEDYAAQFAGFDFGDLPESEGIPPTTLYNTLLASGGPFHGVPDFDGITNTAPLMLGASIDLETDGVPSATANGDDLAGIAPSDEDGLTNGPITFTTTAGATAAISVVNNTDEPAHLVGWIDVNDNGDLENTAQERVIASVAAQTSATIDLVFSPTTVVSGSSFARFRLFPGDAPSPPTAESPSPNGFSLAGEVEDYPVTLTDDGGLTN